MFSRSSRDEDDEEALRWAALEKLPTYDRARTAVLAMPEGELREINIQRLGVHERHALLQRIAINSPIPLFQRNMNTNNTNKYSSFNEFF